MRKLKIKVCGMREPGNIAGVAERNPDFMGFIFYPKSKRFVRDEDRLLVAKAIPSGIQKVGVFVNELFGKIIETGHNWELDVVQLHGDESPADCLKIKNAGFTVFKAFSVDESFDFEALKEYRDCCDYFLFDTKGKLPGGTGQKFNWQLLEKYTMEVPFFLSGGIEPGDVKAIRNFWHPQLFGLDINSGFETEPGMKDVEKVKAFISEIQSK